jgi:chemotaxis regulatin CheY-phosphate phosphatase CheZ
MDDITSRPVADVATAMTVRLEHIAEALQREVERLGGLSPGSEAEAKLSQLQDEVCGMGRLIAETRAEMAGLMPPGFAGSRLATASDELDGVVGATERAAVEIMGAAERAQEAAQRLRAVPDLPPEGRRDTDIIEAAVTDIFMACSFQDLTGQRIRKVVGALIYIEQRVEALTLLWQHRVEPHDVAPAHDKREDAHLLNGPGTNGLEQNDIDSLLHAEPAEPASQADIDALFA